MKIEDLKDNEYYSASDITKSTGINHNEVFYMLRYTDIPFMKKGRMNLIKGSDFKKYYKTKREI